MKNMSITQTPSLVNTIVCFTFGLQCTQALPPPRSAKKSN